MAPLATLSTRQIIFLVLVLLASADLVNSTMTQSVECSFSGGDPKGFFISNDRAYVANANGGPSVIV